MEMWYFFYYPTICTDIEYRESKQECNIFFILTSQISVYTSLVWEKNQYNYFMFLQDCWSWFSKYSIRVFFFKLKIFLVPQYRHIIHLFEDEGSGADLMNRLKPWARVKYWVPGDDFTNELKPVLGFNLVQSDSWLSLS